MVRKLNLNTPPGWARLTRLSLSNWSWKRCRPPGKYTQSMRLWDHGHEKSCSPLCWGCWTSVKAVLPHPFREKQGQETEFEGTVDIWSLGTRFSSPLHWQLGTLIPKHILLLLQLVHLGFQPMWQNGRFSELPNQWPHGPDCIFYLHAFPSSSRISGSQSDSAIQDSILLEATTCVWP